MLLFRMGDKRFNAEQREQAKKVAAILTGEGEFAKEDKFILEVSRLRYPDSEDILMVTSPSLFGLMITGGDFQKAAKNAEEGALIIHRWIEERAAE